MFIESIIGCCFCAVVRLCFDSCIQMLLTANIVAVFDEIHLYSKYIFSCISSVCLISACSVMRAMLSGCWCRRLPRHHQIVKSFKTPPWRPHLHLKIACLYCLLELQAFQSSAEHVSFPSPSRQSVYLRICCCPPCKAPFLPFPLYHHNHLNI